MEIMNDFGDLGNPHAPCAGREQRYNGVMEAIFLSVLIFVVVAQAWAASTGWIAVWRAYRAGTFRDP